MPPGLYFGLQRKAIELLNLLPLIKLLIEPQVPRQIVVADEVQCVAITKFTSWPQRTVLLHECIDFLVRYGIDIRTQPGGAQVWPEYVLLEQLSFKCGEVIDHGPVTALDRLEDGSK